MSLLRPTATIDSSGLLLLQQEQADIGFGTRAGNAITVWILNKIQILDDEYSANQWTHYQIAAATVLVLGAVQATYKNKWGVNWTFLLHAIVTAYGSLACVWLSSYAAETLTGTPEPLRSITCQGPLTSLHRILPAITMGYGIFDIIEGFSCGIDFILHGFATFSVMAYFCYYDIGELIVPFLLMEISSVHLNLTKAEFFSKTTMYINMMLFAATFFAFRIFICPYLWWEIFTVTFQQQNYDNHSDSQSCLPWHFQYVVFFFGMFYNLLNAYWGYKILLKLQRTFMANGGKSKNNTNEKTKTT